ncbi:DgyrCDS8931 [Dimorphilus gyrociliatus]|uniref:DgyrCDS8931 n=1 Tax=Dimorphilus gyrociliatus TaxID=2664684 RepID=A0A7I8VX40_9ANNE|nr:DgyrCDS8931 [Dimorphilus gyrociliatus]
MAPNFTGKWEMVKQENFDEYLKALEIGLILRKAAAVFAGKTKLDIEQNGDHFVIVRNGSEKDEFNIGTEFTTKNKLGEMKNLPKWGDNDRLVVDMTPTGKDGKPSTLYRYLASPDEMIVEVHCKDVVMKRYFKRI